MNSTLESCYSIWFTAQCRYEQTFSTASLGPQMRKRLLTVLGLLLSFIALLYWFFTGIHAEHQNFDASVWMSLRESSEMNDPGCIRGGMAIHLVNEKVLLGLSKEELLVMLGSPSDSQPQLVSYALGQCHWDWKHSELAVRIDATGKVTDAEIRLTPFTVMTPQPNIPLQRDAPQAARP